MSIRVVIVDDEHLVRAGLRLILEAEEDLEVVGEAGDGDQAVKLVRDLDPDVVLMDVQMPVMDGIEATRQIVGLGREQSSRVLILTTFDLDEYVYEALRAGASGFLLKRTPAADLVAGIHVLADGEALLAPSITRRLLDAFAGQRPSAPASLPPGMDELTAREREVLVLIAQGMSNGEIATELFLSEGTVKTHVKRIFFKLDLRDRVQAVIVAYDAGLVTPHRG